MTSVYVLINREGVLSWSGMIEKVVFFLINDYVETYQGLQGDKNSPLRIKWPVQDSNRLLIIVKIFHYFKLIWGVTKDIQ